MLKPSEQPAAPLISVILPTFNRLQYLPDAVASVCAQTFQDWELLIADDGSDAETRAYLQALQDPPRTRLIQMAHTGKPAMVRNAALREARGEYVAFMDSDDVWARSKLQTQIDRLRSTDALQWSYTGFDFVDDSGNAIVRPRIQRSGPIVGRVLDRLVREEALIVTPSVVVRRDLIEQAGGFSEDLLACEDYELWMRLAARVEADFIDEPLVLVRRHAEHSFDDVTCLENLRLAIEMIQRSGAAAHLDTLLSKRRASVSANLARAHAIAKHRARAVATLLSSAPYSWPHAAWWAGAMQAMARAFAPVRVLRALRPHRRGGRIGAGRTP